MFGLLQILVQVVCLACYFCFIYLFRLAVMTKCAFWINCAVLDSIYYYIFSMYNFLFLLICDVMCNCDKLFSQHLKLIRI